jgi:hypothetical protein
MQTIINWVQGDYNASLSFVLENADSSVFDLTNYTLAFNAQLQTVSGLKFTGSITKDSPTLGTCHYAPVSTDFSQPGIYQCQIVATSSNPASEITWSDIQVIVESRVPVY